MSLMTLSSKKTAIQIICPITFKIQMSLSHFISLILKNWFEDSLLTVDLSLTYNYIRTRQYHKAYYMSLEKGMLDEQFAIFLEQV